MKKPTDFKCHQVSQVLLRQFTKNSELLVHHKEQKPRVTGSGGVGYVFEDKELYNSTELNWGITETAFPKILHSVKKGLILSDLNNTKLLKKMIALHYVRSLAVQKKFKLEEKHIISETLRDINPLHHTEFIKRWDKDIEKNKRDFIIENIEKVSNFLEGKFLQIAVATGSANFILGDVPVINLLLEGPSGIIQGVGIVNSDVVFMPLSPRHLVSLTSFKEHSRYFLLPSKEVRKINDKTKFQILREFYTLPLS